jgi:hypothetical protein
MAEIIESEPLTYRGSIVGVWISEVTGKPMLIIEASNGRVFTAKVKEVWPSKQVGKGAIGDTNESL